MTSRSVEKSKDESRDDKETDEDEEKDDGKKRDGSREDEGVGEKDVEMTEEEREEKERREKEERIAASIKKREAEVARELSGITNNNSYWVRFYGFDGGGHGGPRPPRFVSPGPEGLLGFRASRCITFFCIVPEATNVGGP